MSTRQQGNKTENLVAEYLKFEHGYYCYPSRGSRAIDLICIPNEFETLPGLAIEVGTKSKSVTQAFTHLQHSRVPPGFFRLVCRKIIKNGRITLRWHTDSGRHGTDDFLAAITEIRQNN